MDNGICCALNCVSEVDFPVTINIIDFCLRLYSNEKKYADQSVNVYG